MLTSEAERAKVVSAAELAPTDYLLKPFTVDLISTRIKRVFPRVFHFFRRLVRSVLRVRRNFHNRFHIGATDNRC